MRLKTLVALGTTVVTLGGGAVAASALTGSTANAGTLIGSRQIRDNSIRSVDIHDGTLRWVDLNDHTQRVIRNQASSVVKFTSDPTTVQHMGGKFADNATEVGQLTLDPGTYEINAEGFYESTAATSGASQLELALRGPISATNQWGDDYGTCFTGETPPTKGRDVSCASTKVVTVTAPTTVDVKAFGYQDDQSSTDSGSWSVVAIVNAIRVG